MEILVLIHLLQTTKVVFCQEDRNNATHKSQANISVNNSGTGTI